MTRASVEADVTSELYMLDPSHAFQYDGILTAVSAVYGTAPLNSKVNRKSAISNMFTKKILLIKW